MSQTPKTGNGGRGSVLRVLMTQGTCRSFELQGMEWANAMRRLAKPHRKAARTVLRKQIPLTLPEYNILSREIGWKVLYALPKWEVRWKSRNVKADKLSPFPSVGVPVVVTTDPVTIITLTDKPKRVRCARRLESDLDEVVGRYAFVGLLEGVSLSEALSYKKRAVMFHPAYAGPLRHVQKQALKWPLAEQREFTREVAKKSDQFRPIKIVAGNRIDDYPVPFMIRRGGDCSFVEMVRR
jgi:hypothetical protein